MIRRLRLFSVVAATLFGSVSAVTVSACPFCTAITKTLSEDIATNEVAIIAKLTDLPGASGTQDSARTNSPTARFAIDRVLKGSQQLGSAKSLSSVFFGDAKPGDLFLMFGNRTPQLKWSPPMRLNQRQHHYILALAGLPKEGPERLNFFQEYLEDSDTLLARDAYDEFARAPYSVVKKLKPFMNHDQLVQWITAPNVPASRRRLYLTMLGVCGTKEDLPLVEERLRRTDTQSKSGLDAAIACFLTLRGEEGVDLIEDLFLKKREGNFSDNYVDVNAAIMALRFHGIEGDVVSRDRILRAFALLLDNPQMADLVIPDLARWEDWSQLERLVTLFKQTDPKASWVRIPIVNFARVCPRPEAKDALKVFEQLDPESVKRSRTLLPTIPQPKK